MPALKSERFVKPCQH